MSKILPTVGRNIYYHDGPHSADAQPNLAFIVYVHNEKEVNLLCVDHNGHTYTREKVRLYQDDEAKPINAAYAEWMPYQVGQAKKTDSQGGASPPNLPRFGEVKV